MLLTAAALTWDRKLIPALPGTPQTCAARLAHRACSSARRTRTRTSQDKQCPCQERSYDTGKQTEFSYSQVFLCTSCATAGHKPRPDGAFRSLTLISPCAHQCGLQIVPSRCPSVRPADCAVHVPISAACRLCRPGDHQCGLQFVPSRCPSVRPAVCAVQVPISAACRLCRPGAHRCGLRFAIRRKPWALWVQRP